MKSYKTLILFFVALIVLGSCNSKNSDRSDANKINTDENSYSLVWSEEFDYSGLPDSTKWIYDTEGNDSCWGNKEVQHYTVDRKENAIVQDGKLRITALRESMEGKEYTSARLMSNADWKYGKIVVSAKLPDGVGTWPAIWMMPGNWTFNDGNWPEVGEIDIMEHVGHDKGVVHASAHTKDYQWKVGTQKTGNITIPEATEKFHEYSLEWTHESLKAFVDDSLYFEYKNKGLGNSKWPFDKPFYLILNLAVGGHWGGAQGINPDAFPQTMEVDYVRVYQKSEDK